MEECRTGRSAIGEGEAPAEPRNIRLHSNSQTQGLAAPAPPPRRIHAKIPLASMPAAPLRQDTGTVLVGELLYARCFGAGEAPAEPSRTRYTRPGRTLPLPHP